MLRPIDANEHTSSLSGTASSMPVDTLLFVVVVVLLLLRVRLRLVPDSRDEKLGIDEGVDNDVVDDTEVDIDEAAGNDAEVGMCVRIELEEI